jgi:hypothetical protein
MTLAQRIVTRYKAACNCSLEKNSQKDEEAMRTVKDVVRPTTTREVTYICTSCGERLVYDGKLPEYRRNHRREGGKCDGALIEVWHEHLAASDEVAMEFPTEDALNKYLQEHPKANKSKHTVKKHEDKGESGSGAEKPKTHDHPEFKDKSSPYFVNTENKWLKELGDPATWNRSEVMKHKEKLLAPFKGQGMKEDSPAEKARSEAIRQISNWNLLTHDDKD